MNILSPALTALPAASPAASPASSPRQIPIPALVASPAPPLFSQSDQYQAAKYFTFIFFGLSVFVIILFGAFVVCHCYRRLRYERDRRSSPEGEQASQGQPPHSHGNIEIPVKQGFVVQNPDGGLNVAYIPDTPRAPSGAKSAPGSPSSVGRLPGSAASSPAADGQAGSPGSSLEPPSGGSSIRRDGSGECPSTSGPEESSAQRGEGRRGWGRIGIGSPAPAPEGNHNADIENQLPQPQAADTAWRQRQAGLFHMF